VNTGYPVDPADLEIIIIKRSLNQVRSFHANLPCITNSESLQFHLPFLSDPQVYLFVMQGRFVERPGAQAC
jgi:hypothetical protein